LSQTPSDRRLDLGHRELMTGEQRIIATLRVSKLVTRAREQRFFFEFERHNIVRKTRRVSNLYHDKGLCFMPIGRRLCLWHQFVCKIHMGAGLGLGTSKASESLWSYCDGCTIWHICIIRVLLIQLNMMVSVHFHVT